MFYRVVGGEVFGVGLPTPKVGETLEGVFATPHPECAQAILAWENDFALETQGGGSWAALLVLEGEGRPVLPGEKTGHNPRTDRDEVVITKARVVGVFDSNSTPSDWRALDGG